MERKRLFQKIFGVGIDTSDANRKIMDTSGKYPYFIAPLLFGEVLNERDHAFVKKAELFFPNPLMHLYAEKDELIHFSDPRLSEIPDTSEKTEPIHMSEVGKMFVETGSPQSEEIGPVPVPLTALPSADLEPGFSEEMGPFVPDLEPASSQMHKKGQATVPQSTPGELVFEPLHTTDYFASQGIRISEEVNAGDKLGTQLKSFTEWLKTMKKLPAAGNRPVLNTPYDKQVEKLAEKSNREEDVITESMAEAYLSQGKKQKAIEIYEKLSLQNPSKSAYFAAKIAGLSPGAYPV